MTVRTAATLLSALLVVTAMTVPPASAGGAESAAGRQHGGDWTSAWGTSMQPAYDDSESDSNWSDTGFEDQTVRQVVRLGNGGERLRIRLSNAYGERALHLEGATVARTAASAAGSTAGGADVEPGSVRRLTFRGRDSAVVPTGRERYSDPVAMRTEALESVTVTLSFDRPTGPATYHSMALATTYRADGEHLTDVSGEKFDDTSTSWYFLDGVEVESDRRYGGAEENAVVALGDSITDGWQSGTDANNRWPDELTERLAATGNPMAVVNAGISGNRLLNPSVCFGETAADRLERDVLSRAGVSTMILFEGINDIGHSEESGPCVEANPEATADELIAAQRDLIRRAHRRGIEVIGATLLPYRGAAYFSERGERVREEVNHWIRHSGAFDAVVDLERALADPANPDRLNPAYDSGDHLHPNEAGMRAIAEAVDLALLRC